MGFLKSLRTRIVVPVAAFTAVIVGGLSIQTVRAQRNVARQVHARVESIAEVFGQIFATSVLEGQSADFERLQSVIDSVVDDDRAESRHRPPFLAFVILREGDEVVGAANASVLDARWQADLRSLDTLRARARELDTRARTATEPAAIATAQHDARTLLVEREKERDDVLTRIAKDPAGPGLRVYDARLFDCRPFNCPSDDAGLERYAVADVLVGVNYRPFLVEARRSNLLLWAISLGALFVGGAGAFAVARRVTTPVRGLVDAMGDIERGNLDRRVDVKRSDELGLLASSFNVMAEGLAERERLRAESERLKTERTALQREVAIGEARSIALEQAKDALERRNERVQKLLEALASRAVAEQFLETGREPSFVGEDVEATILFADIRGFTPMCERLDTAEIFGLLNEYFGRMRAIVERYEGTILKFMGDALMVSFNVPEPLDAHAARAVYAGIDMQREIRALNKTREAQGKPPLEVGIGINTGRVMVGKIGSEERFDFTVIGDAVNTAQRIESITPAQHLHVSESTWLLVKEAVEVVQREPVVLKGKEHPVSIYAVLHRSRTPARFLTRDERAQAARRGMR